MECCCRLLPISQRTLSLRPSPASPPWEFSDVIDSVRRLDSDLASQKWTVGLCCNFLKSGSDFKLNGADVFVY